MTFNFDSPPMKYWAMPAATPKEKRTQEIERMIESGDYIYGRKYDGNWSRAVLTPDRNALQTRGISKKTGTYGEIQTKVLFWEAITHAFEDTTVLLGEVYLDEGIDKDVGSILRCLDDKALARQQEKPLKWKIFDVLVYEGQDLQSLGAAERFKYIPKAVAAIKHPLVSGVDYTPMDETFYFRLKAIFADGGEGVVAYRKGASYIGGKRGPSAHDSLKIKKELNSDIDCFIIGYGEPTRTYRGKDLYGWEYWFNTKTGERLCGLQFAREYAAGAAHLEPVTKNFFNGWCGYLQCGVYNSAGEVVHICDCSGLTEDLKEAILADPNAYLYHPLRLGGMMVSTDRFGGVSIRHPYLISLRDDIDSKDCTLSKIIGEQNNV